MADMFNPPHPGSLVREAMESLGLSASAFADVPGVSAGRSRRLIAEKSSITPEMTIRLAATIGSTPTLWPSLQSDYLLWHAKQRIDTGNLERLS